MRTVRRTTLGVVLALGLVGPATAQQMAGSLEAGLQTLAQALLTALPAGQRPVLSVMPFPASDQTCPTLSVFVVDELTTTLISAVQPRPRVVERQQLEAVIAQHRLDEFLTDPEKRRRLGGLSGIGALMVGTYTVIGDRVRVNARLVAIDSGETMAAAAVSIPRTGELTELLRQDSRRGRNCLGDPAARGTHASTTNAGAGPSPRPVTSGEACDEQDGLRTCVRNLRRNGQDVQILLEVENYGTTPVALAAVGPPPSLVGHDGTAYTVTDVSGVPLCGRQLTGGYMHAQWQDNCLRGGGLLSRQLFRTLPAGARTPITLRFRSDEASHGEGFMLNAALAVLPRLPSAMPAAEAERLAARLFLVTLPDVRPGR